MLRKFLRNRKGQGLVEYALLVCGIAVVALAGISTLGHKTSDLIDTAAVLLPGAHQADNNPIMSGHLIETDTSGVSGAIEVSTTGVIANQGTDRIGTSLFGTGPATGNGLGGLIIESQ